MHGQFHEPERMGNELHCRLAHRQEPIFRNRRNEYFRLTNQFLDNLGKKCEPKYLWRFQL